MNGENRTCAPYVSDIVICDKKTNLEALRLADLMVRRVGLHILRAGPANGAFETLAVKLFGG